MPLLDGKYEIIAERDLGERQTMFEAIAPDGTAVRVVWFELTTSEEEAAFERYRQLLRRLTRDDLTAIFDIVSRPGAHYVAWLSGGEAIPASRVPSDIAARLAELAVKPSEADIRSDGHQTRIYGLAFDGKLLLPPPPPPTARKTEPRGSTLAQLWHNVPESLRRNLPGLALAATGLIFLWSGLALRSNDRLVAVPNLTETEVNEAAEALHDLGFQVTLEAVPSDEGAGRVVGSSPNEGTLLRPGREVLLRYAQPAGALADTEVPDLRGRTFSDELIARLEEARLELGNIAHVSANIGQGTVLSQSLPPGARAPEGTTVDVLVSDGPAGTVTFLPDLTGLELDVARQLVRDAGLTGEIEEVTVPTARAPSGTVLSQSIAPYREIPAGAANLRLEIAGPATGSAFMEGDVPSLVGLPLEEAQTMLEEAGFEIGTIDYVGTRALSEGVVGQTPQPGADTTDAAIDLLVNVFPVALPTPQITAEVRRNELRRPEYRWVIETGIPVREAVVTATTLAGDEFEVERTEVRGGESLEGTWLTTAPGPIEFRLTLNDIPYGTVQRDNP